LGDFFNKKGVRLYFGRFFSLTDLVALAIMHDAADDRVHHFQEQKAEA
jgi:hypothetical protein